MLQFGYIGHDTRTCSLLKRRCTNRVEDMEVDFEECKVLAEIYRKERVNDRKHWSTPTVSSFTVGMQVELMVSFIITLRFISVSLIIYNSTVTYIIVMQYLLKYVTQINMLKCGCNFASFILRNVSNDVKMIRNCKRNYTYKKQHAWFENNVMKGNLEQ